MLLVHPHPPQQGNLAEGTCEPVETQHRQSGQLMGSVEKERRERSQQPAPDKWIYKGGHKSVITFRNTELIIFAAADLFKIW